MFRRTQLLSRTFGVHIKSGFWSHAMKYPLLASLIASLGIGLSGAAHAVNVDVNIGSPAPVVVGPAPVVVEQGWHGDRYWDGHRYWERQEWQEHNRHHDGHGDDQHEHCPPGHAKKGEC